MAPNATPAHPALTFMAPLADLVAEGVLLEALVGLLEAEIVGKAGVVEPAKADVWPPRGAVDRPAISDRIEAEKVPVILLRLFRLKIWSYTCEQ